MKVHPSTWKTCATCEFWTGGRTTHIVRKTVQVEASAKGKCLRKMKGEQKNENGWCPGWTKLGIFSQLVG